jgi:hypothetical protein
LGAKRELHQQAHQCDLIRKNITYSNRVINLIKAVECATACTHKL